MRPCPECGGQIKDHVTQCKFCLKTVPAWDGTGTPPAGPALPSTLPPAPSTLQVVTADQRRSALSRAVQSQVHPGMRIESQSDYQSVLVFGTRTNHILHFLIGLFTLGVWWIVWLILGLTNRERRRMIAVDEYGRISSRDF